MSENNKMKRDETCANCPHMGISDLCGLKLAYCNYNGVGFGQVIPHESQLKDNKRGNPTIIKFFRVPLECKRSDQGVLKSVKRTSRDNWITKEF